MKPIKRLTATDTGFWGELDQLLQPESIADDAVTHTVKDILQAVRSRGDEAIIEFTRRFDRLTVTEFSALEIDLTRLAHAAESVSPDEFSALQYSAERLRLYHERQRSESWSYTEADGTLLGQKITPLDRVGLYVPGGKAAYPSSVLMSAIPARVAGVKELIMVVPTPDGIVNDMVLAAAHIAQVDKIFTIGGAQAIAALAYGTESVPQVDKIVGPGNSYVATAKKMVFGTVGIDMIAGPSEILIVCDGQTDPDWIAMDLFSQAEHDEEAQSILVSTDKKFLDQVQDSIVRLLPTMERQEIIEASLAARAALIAAPNLNVAAEIVNVIAPEHLELSVDDPLALSEKIRHAGAIFMGRYTAEAIGDYVAGSNHVLPTSRTARFSSPLGVYDFQKRSSLIMCSPDGAQTLGRYAAVLARSEGLTAHAKSAEYRLKK
ncbi:MAG: histidinol dehydrogenase [Gammaproteobacteria bacterium]|nr:histidinol dehydrogenase [Gammaproteobacteria bacterium]